jgi:hypothetical protein
MHILFQPCNILIFQKIKNLSLKKTFKKDITLVINS